jgi:hypothetical protein
LRDQLLGHRGGAGKERGRKREPGRRGGLKTQLELRQLFDWKVPGPGAFEYAVDVVGHAPAATSRISDRFERLAPCLHPQRAAAADFLGVALGVERDSRSGLATTD